MNSPPKRVTRARAAAKGTEPSVKTTKIVTAAAKARTAPSSGFMAGTRSTAAKRKARTDEKDDEELERRELMAKRPRGRPKKEEDEDEVLAAAPAPAAGKATAKSKPIARKAASEAPKAEAKPLRGRPKKVASADEGKDAHEPAAKTTRGRSSTLTKTSASTTTTSTIASKPPIKKAVKFQEPDKENVEPNPKEPATVGIRGRPARRGGAAAARASTRATATATDASEKKPLSPKKVTQIPMTREESDDELSTEKTPTKPLMKSPIKPPTAKKMDVLPVDFEIDSNITVNTAMFNPPDMNTVIFGSPIRRPTSPLRETMKSPAKRIGPIALPGSALKPTTDEHTGQTSFMTHLLQSAAKRPQSPIKGLGPSAQMSQITESPSKPAMFQSPAKRAIPGFKPLMEPLARELSALNGSPAMKPLASTPIRFGKSSEKLMLENDVHEDADEDVFTGPIEGPQFSGRLSAVLPRHADPTLNEMEAVDEEDEEVPQLVQETLEIVEADEALEEDQDPDETMDENEDPMPLDEIAAEMEESPSCHPKRRLDQQTPFLKDDTLPIDRITATPTLTNQKTPKSLGIARSVSKSGRRSTLGFTTLADQLDSWSAASPVKAPRPTRKAKSSAASKKVVEQVKEDPSSMKNTYFEDEMRVHSEPTTTPRTTRRQSARIQKPTSDDIMLADEDTALAQEANEMSLLDSREVEEPVNHRQSFDDGLSDASQEYGDENQIPVDPAIVVPVTPARPLMKSFHTTTKIPLKPADDSSPSPLKKRSFSASRIAPKRPSNLSKGTATSSNSPSKERRRSSRKSISVREDTAPTTPTKTDVWSTAETPGRTPRKDLDTSLLRGAIVFVDVHTSEGADASGIFVELLTQMGARCVKSWNWNPSSPSDGGVSSNKVGITHVVFKDGGKRTLEKVREANGVVQCVGVSWVLDCERENEWLDESPYCIDTSNIPRGGARRRKSMEPKALANMNGTIVSSPNKSGRESMGAPTTPNRRQSTIWMHTPSEAGDDEEEEEDIEWSKLLLTPVPKTPAPEAIARFAAETPSDDDDEEEEEDEDMSPSRNDMLTRTCPPKQKFREFGGGILNKTQDDHVLVRLMAARRKSLQFAPKVGSPLAKMWRQGRE
ncbi:hypothetical protein PT974_06345 [Cladobotryum mycophilum]|uniref:BRCT domain-containing protein n=1 Tax=Cladobotryum mycophilum TaxID=491253 RepID=A0ABR0SL94_9HYPO